MLVSPEAAEGSGKSGNKIALFAGVWSKAISAPEHNWALSRLVLHTDISFPWHVLCPMSFAQRLGDCLYPHPWLVLTYDTLVCLLCFRLLRPSLRTQRPYMQVRGKATVDGFFSTPRAQFGSPDIPTADEVVRITVFPTTSIPMQSDKPGDLISPDLLDRYSSCILLCRLSARSRRCHSRRYLYLNSYVK